MRIRHERKFIFLVSDVACQNDVCCIKFDDFKVCALIDIFFHSEHLHYLKQSIGFSVFVRNFLMTLGAFAVKGTMVNKLNTISSDSRTLTNFFITFTNQASYK